MSLGGGRDGGGRIESTTKLALEPNFSLNWVTLPAAEFTNSVISERTTYTISPHMFVSALTQYNSASRTFSTNARFRWEFRPGSEMFVVYSDARDTASEGFLPVFNRAFILKIKTAPILITARSRAPVFLRDCSCRTRMAPVVPS